MSAAAPSTTTPLFSTAGSAERQRASKPQAVERVGNGTSQQPTNGSNLDLLPVILHWFCNPAASKRNHTSRTPQSAADSQSLLPASPKASVQATNPLWGRRGRAEGEAERERELQLADRGDDGFTSRSEKRIIFPPPLLLSHQIRRDSGNTWQPVTFHRSGRRWVLNDDFLLFFFFCKMPRV